jgi:hypothetical protein
VMFRLSRSHLTTMCIAPTEIQRAQSKV